ncbi:hypothetical protein UY3_04607 [Chelonia mydas]|uniref:Uncharacterized protein n=1 Tax=Chelonia mydas TaxID=8469 RepID=M7BR35_CHEMY|nr:hypothetical protein UY3_04607 [Chelonia mydas]
MEAAFQPQSNRPGAEYLLLNTQCRRTIGTEIGAKRERSPAPVAPLALPRGKPAMMSRWSPVLVPRSPAPEQGQQPCWSRALGVDPLCLKIPLLHGPPFQRPRSQSWTPIDLTGAEVDGPGHHETSTLTQHHGPCSGSPWHSGPFGVPGPFTKAKDGAKGHIPGHCSASATFVLPPAQSASIGSGVAPSLLDATIPTSSAAPVVSALTTSAPTAPTPSVLALTTSAPTASALTYTAPALRGSIPFVLAPAQDPQVPWDPLDMEGRDLLVGVSSFPSSDEALAGTSGAPALQDNRVLQQLLKRDTQSLGIQAEEVVEDADPVVDTLTSSRPTRIALSFIKTIADTIKTLWQTPASLPPMAKRNERRYFVPSRGYEHLYTHPSPDSLVMDAANQRERQGYQVPSPKNWEVKRLSRFGRKVYSTGGLQLRISNQQAIVSSYCYNTCGAMAKFVELLLQDSRAEFLALVEENKLIS